MAVDEICNLIKREKRNRQREHDLALSESSTGEPMHSRKRESTVFETA